MAELKTNYKDDVLDASVNKKRRYNLVPNDDGTVSLEDVTTYLQTGDSFGAKDINETNAKVNEQNNNLTQLGGFTPVIDETGKITGYTTTKGGADTVFPFSSNLKVGQASWATQSDTNILTTISKDSAYVIAGNIIIGEDNDGSYITCNGGTCIYSTGRYNVWNHNRSYYAIAIISVFKDVPAGSVLNSITDDLGAHFMCTLVEDN